VEAYANHCGRGRSAASKVDPRNGCARGDDETSEDVLGLKAGAWGIAGGATGRQEIAQNLMPRPRHKYVSFARGSFELHLTSRLRAFFLDLSGTISACLPNRRSLSSRPPTLPVHGLESFQSRQARPWSARKSACPRVKQFLRLLSGAFAPTADNGGCLAPKTVSADRIGFGFRRIRSHPGEGPREGRRAEG
jgi:hypothetical protein